MAERLGWLERESIECGRTAVGRMLTADDRADGSSGVATRAAQAGRQRRGE